MKENFGNEPIAKPKKEEKLYHGEPMSVWQKVGEKKDDNKPEVEKSLIEKLWKSYHFYGSAPVEGSGSYNRLHNLCESYIKYLFNDKLINTTGSEPMRRELHNQIALMVLGKLRTNMDPKKAEDVADFACMFATGLHIKDVEAVKFDTRY